MVWKNAYGNPVEGALVLSLAWVFEVFYKHFGPLTPDEQLKLSKLVSEIEDRVEKEAAADRPSP